MSFISSAIVIVPYHSRHSFQIVHQECSETIGKNVDTMNPLLCRCAFKSNKWYQIAPQIVLGNLLDHCSIHGSFSVTTVVTTGYINQIEDEESQIRA